jgi:transcription initiation factor TFIIIB Brf1 subunit/transcription initiation factor TFIIB
MTSIDDIWDIGFPKIDFSSKEINLPNVNCLCGKKPEIINTDYDIVCKNCGLVLYNDNIVSSDVIHGFFDESGKLDKFNHYGDPTSDSHNTVIPGNSYMAKLNMWLNFSYKDRCILDTTEKFRYIVLSNNLPEIFIKRSVNLYKELISIKDKTNEFIPRGPNRTGLLCVCLYNVCQLSHCYMSPTNAMNMFDIDIKTFSKCLKLYNEITSKNLTMESGIDRCFSRLRLSFKIQKVCKSIIESCKKLNLFRSSSPKNVLSGVIYFVCKELDIDLDVSDICKILDVKISGIKRIYRVLVKDKIRIFNTVKISQQKN